MLRKFIASLDFGRIFAHVTFTTMFVYDIMGNNNDFGWENAGLYAGLTFGGEIILKIAKLRYGASDVDSKQLETGGGDSGGGGIPDALPTSKLLPRKKPKTGKGKRRSF